MPPAMTSASVSIVPCSVSTPVTSPRVPSWIPVTRCCVKIVAPILRAAEASAWVAVCGSRWPSLGTQTAPCRERVVMAGMRRADSSAETSSTSRPIPRARLTPRCNSLSCSSLEANRSPPTWAKTPSSWYSSMLYRRNRIIVGEGLNWVTRPAAWHVEPLVSSSFSTRTVSRQPAFARGYATLAPVPPPPTTPALARSPLSALTVVVRFGPSVRQGSLPGLGKQEKEKRAHDRCYAAQLDRAAQTGRRCQVADRLQAHDAADRRGYRCRQLCGRAGSRRKELRGPRAEDRCGGAGKGAPQDVADVKPHRRRREAETRRDRGRDREHDGGTTP